MVGSGRKWSGVVGNGREWSQMVGVSGGGLCVKWGMVGGSRVVSSGRWWSVMVGSGQKLSEMVGVSDGGCVEVVGNGHKCRGRGGCSVKVCKCNCFANVTTEEADRYETPTSEEDLPEDFFNFDSDSDKPEEGLDEENPVFSSESESELPEI